VALVQGREGAEQSGVRPGTVLEERVFPSSDVKRRYNQFPSELLQRAEDANYKGNAAVAAGKLDDASMWYIRIATELELIHADPDKRASMDEAESKRFRHLQAKGVSNMSAVLLKQRNFPVARAAATEALNYDPQDEFGMRHKLLFRRAMAAIEMGDYDDAVKDLSDPALATSNDAAVYHRKANAQLAASNASQRNFWKSAMKRSTEKGKEEECKEKERREESAERPAVAGRTDEDERKDGGDGREEEKKGEEEKEVKEEEKEEAVKAVDAVESFSSADAQSSWLPTVALAAVGIGLLSAAGAYWFLQQQRSVRKGSASPSL
jgi:hypothetical protein